MNGNVKPDFSGSCRRQPEVSGRGVAEAIEHPRFPLQVLDSEAPLVVVSFSWREKGGLIKPGNP
jgi:hypothetical protein